ncbi:MAG: nucleoside kinase [Candidatus Wallbacteria bacterium]|nr:nucleoside kinase [Candidatus Wallbacteria bacterium]
MKSIQISVWPETNTFKEIERGTKLSELIPDELKNQKFPSIVARYNNHVVDLHSQADVPGIVRFQDIRSQEGMEAYRRSANFLLCRSFLDVYRNGRIEIGHSLGNNYFYDVTVEIPVDDEVIDILMNRMQQIISDNESFFRITMNREEAIKLFSSRGLNDKVRLLATMPKESVRLYTCGNFCDLDLGPLVPSTGYLKVLALRRYEEGMVLSFPDRVNPDRLSPLKHYRKLFTIYHESKEWRKILKVNDIGRLNEFALDGRINKCIKATEVLHENKISRIADRITEKKDRIRIVLIAGPSASGKTTFSNRLAVHLHVNGIKSVPISLDNYFFNRDKTPRDENGDYDFESIYALDLELFNKHLLDLVRGEEVQIPKFDFETGSRSGQTVPLRIAENQIIIIEGIHGLNDLLTRSVPAENKFKIYVSALTQVSIDDFNRIHTNDVRLIRRIVRDQQYRGYSAVDTLKRWPSVRRGEERNIFPFQENADVMFNSALIYGLGVLKKLVTPLLKEVSADTEEFTEAKRLLDFLEKLVEVDATNEIPPTSILREFIGGSSFDY